VDHGVPAVAAVAALLVVAAPASCHGRSGAEEGHAVSSPTIEEVLAAHTDSLMALPGVVGTAIGLCDGTPCIRVFLADARVQNRERIPTRLEGYRVQAEVTGPILPRGGGGVAG